MLSVYNITCHHYVNDTLYDRLPARLIVVKYTIYTKVCGDPFKFVDSPIADRCIKSSTQPCNLYRPTMAVEELSDFQRDTVIGCHLSNKSVCQIDVLLKLPWSNVSAVIVKWKGQGAITAQPRSGRPHKPTEYDR